MTKYKKKTKEVVKATIEKDDIDNILIKEKKINKALQDINSTQTIEPIVIDKKVLDKLSDKQKQELIKTTY